MLSVNGMEVHYLSIAGHRLKHFVFFGWSARHPIHLANLNITSHPRHVFFVSVFFTGVAHGLSTYTRLQDDSGFSDTVSNGIVDIVACEELLDRVAQRQGGGM